VRVVDALPRPEAVVGKAEVGLGGVLDGTGQALAPDWSPGSAPAASRTVASARSTRNSRAAAGPGGTLTWRARIEQPRPAGDDVALASTLTLVVLEAGTRRRSQPAPPHVIFEALTDPDRDPARPWLLLLDDEQPPHTPQAAKPYLVMWSSIWRKRPDAMVRFDLPSDGAAGTNLRWTLLLEEPLSEPSLVAHVRKRLNQLINANLRYTFGQ
jgi:hypothetical protein